MALLALAAASAALASAAREVDQVCYYSFVF